jgi:predicted  nucleic acid-binding Zn-ribbon protein
MITKYVIESLIRDFQEQQKDLTNKISAEQNEKVQKLLLQENNTVNTIIKTLTTYMSKYMVEKQHVTQPIEKPKKEKVVKEKVNEKQSYGISALLS